MEVLYQHFVMGSVKDYTFDKLVSRAEKKFEQMVKVIIPLLCDMLF